MLASLIVLGCAVGTEREPTTEVPIFIRDVPRGAVVTRDDLALVSLPPFIIPSGTIFDHERIAGRIALEPTFEYDFALRARLGEPGLEPWSPWVADGHTATRIDFPIPRSLPRPGQTVDVVATDGPPCLVQALAPVVAVENASGRPVLDHRTKALSPAAVITLPADRLGYLPQRSDAVQLWVREPAPEVEEHPLPECSGSDI